MTYEVVKSTTTARKLEIDRVPRSIGMQLTLVDSDETRLGSITVNPSTLAEALSRVSGFTVKYEEPIHVPEYLGACVEREIDGPSGRPVRQRWVRYTWSTESSLPWVSKDGDRRSDTNIAGVLANGGYERQPEFPPNHG